MVLRKGSMNRAPAEGSDRRRYSRDLPGLLTELRDPDPNARRWAARDLAAYPDPQAVAALVAQLPEESEASVREAIFTTLIRLRSPEAVAGLVAALRSDDAALRNEAIEALKQLPDEVAPIIQGLLADPDPDVRILAVNILEGLPHPDVERWLIEVISRDPHVNVCATAIDLLGEVGSEAAVAAIEALKGRFPSEPYIAFATDLALQRIGVRGRQ